MIEKEDGGVRILGSLRTGDGRGVVRMEDLLETPADDVWSALTDPGRLSLWLGILEGDLRQGGAFHARFFASGWEGAGRVEVCEPPHRLLVRTRDPGDPDRPDDHAIEVTLAADGGKTALSWEERGMPANLLAAYGAGIQIHVEDLAAYLAGRDPRGGEAEAKARWERLLPAYEELAAGVPG